MLGIYFSGTGNTKYIVSRLVKGLDENATLIVLENKECVNKIKECNDLIVFGYPTQFSSCPYFIKDFINKNKDIWKDKKILIVSTMGLMSGDAAGCSSRILKKYKAKIKGGLHIKMPDSVADSKLLKKTREDNLKTISKAESKVDKWIINIKNNKYPKDGLSIFHHIGGLFSQRLWFYNKTINYSNKLKFDYKKCVGCFKCASLCPMKNIKIESNKPISLSKCTMCYRCIVSCPTKAITLLGNEVIEQVKLSDYR